MKVLLNNLQSAVEVTVSLESIVKQVIQQAAHTEQAEGVVGITLVDDPYIQDLNRRFRSKDVPTDVLSFPDGTDDDGDYYLGDVIVSLERALMQAEEYGHSLERELGFLVVHGFLHLLGYDHLTSKEATQMEEKTEAILAFAGLSRT